MAALSAWNHAPFDVLLGHPRNTFSLWGTSGAGFGQLRHRNPDLVEWIDHGGSRFVNERTGRTFSHSHPFGHALFDSIGVGPQHGGEPFTVREPSVAPRVVQCGIDHAARNGGSRVCGQGEVQRRVGSRWGCCDCGAHLVRSERSSGCRQGGRGLRRAMMRRQFLRYRASDRSGFDGSLCRNHSKADPWCRSAGISLRWLRGLPNQQQRHHQVQSQRDRPGRPPAATSHRCTEACDDSSSGTYSSRSAGWH